MKPIYRKPTKRDWLTYIIMFIIGNILAVRFGGVDYEPAALDKATSFLSSTLIGVSIGGIIGQYLNLRRYRKQTPEDRRDADLAATDERIIMLESRAARVTLDLTLSLLAVAALLLAAFNQTIAMWVCAALFVLSVLINILALRWFNKHM